ncbi:quercetin dioxygenase-like cupin family protein [Pseudomonas sp. SORGH_AS199]|uniref:cupin domain-containing protein n=1 Tax=Pseudomonas sp. SORGH_AS_0199 TaxID=3041761 RepID=UPI0028654A75|nr:cupin [Pseudomonas sp. SORGH_AS_0199]MDR6228077.1 quercetin dioxygenase-like cupin family protein [Pseudomonas sp. SORGH_AS_0199]
MDQATFIEQLAREGFQPPVLVEREALGSLEAHAHPFEAKALVIEGELRIRTATGERCYAAGEVFHLAAHEPHSEVFGAQGVRYLAGRRPA